MAVENGVLKLETTREIQEVLLEDYKTVSAIWDKHRYYYCLTGGSVLGAIRHEGFIPWDDDFDVGLARCDYNDFIRNSSKELPPYLKLYLRKKTRQYVLLDTRYEIEYNEENIDALFDGESMVAHPTLDLQIFDGTPNNKLLRLLFCLRVMFTRARIKMGNPKKIHEEKWRPLWENLIIRFIRMLPERKAADTDKLIKKYYKLIKKYSFKDSTYIADFIGKYHFKDIYPKAWWVPTVRKQFEDIMVPVPNGYDKYLTQIYGDYMVIPKREDQEQHTK